MSNYITAPTFKILSYANTFGELMGITNALVLQNNDLASNNFTKATGTLYLTDPTLALQVNTASIFQGSVQVIGVGSSTYLQKNLTVDGQTYLNYSGLGPTVTIAGQANVGGPILAYGGNTGLIVANTANIGGRLFVSNTASFANAVSIYGQTYVTNNITITGNTYTNILQANTSVNTATLTVTGYAYADIMQANTRANTATLTVTGTSYTNQLQANSGIAAAALNVTNTTNTNILQANTSVNTTTLTVTSQTYTNTLQANTGIGAAALTVTNTTNTNILQANTSVNTSILTVTGQTYTNTLQANTGIGAAALTVTNTTNTNILQANTSVNTATLTVTGTTYTNRLQANTGIGASALNVTNTTNTNILQANTSVNTSTLTVTGTTYTNRLQANTLLTVPTANATSINVFGTSNTDILNVVTSASIPTLGVSSTFNGNTAVAYVGTLQTLGQLSVGGNFVINGSTVYNSNTLILNANSSIGQISYFGVNRGSAGANATIRWNEPSQYWDIQDVNNPVSYSQIMTANMISSSLSSTSTATVASSSAANTLNTNINVANTFLQANIISGQVSAKSYTDSANTFLQANIIFGLASAKSYTDSANTFLQANIIFGLASAKSYTDSANTYLQSNIIFGLASAKSYTDSANAAIYNYSSSAYARANTSVNSIVGTTGINASATSGSISLLGTYGVTAVSSGNTVTIGTPQDLRSTANPTFNSLTLSVPLALAQGGTGATSAAGALNNILPTPPSSTGQVLTSTGPGTFYWAVGGSGGGGGATPGTTIQSNRVFYTANAGQTLFATPSYIVGASQIRPYINGVRQFPSDYTETSNTSITFANGLTVNDSLMIEVDGYIINPYYANNITFTAPFGGITSTANTIQLAIQDVETRKATLASPTFTGSMIVPTYATSTSNTQVASTAFVYNALANTSASYTHSITGNAGSVTNGIYTNGSYSDPTWLTSLASTKVTGTLTNAQLTNSSLTIGSTSVSLGSTVATFAGVILTSPTFTAPALGTPASGNFSTGTFTWPTFNQNTTGSSGTFTSTTQNSQFNSIGVGTTADTANTGSIIATGMITAYYSDERLKTNLGKIENALDKVSSLNGFYYEPNEVAQELGYDIKREVGVSAQEVQKILPEIVVPAPIDDKYLTVHYERLVPLLIEAIKELKSEIDELKGK